MTEKNEVAVKNECRNLDDYLRLHWDVSCNMLQKFRMILFTLRMLDSRFVMKPVGVCGKPSKPSILFGYEDGIYETDTKKALLVCVRTECMLYGVYSLLDGAKTYSSSVLFGLSDVILDDKTDITRTLYLNGNDEEYYRLHNEFNQYCLLNFGFEPCIDEEYQIKTLLIKDLFRVCRDSSYGVYNGYETQDELFKVLYKAVLKVILENTTERSVVGVNITEDVFKMLLEADCNVVSREYFANLVSDVLDIINDKTHSEIEWREDKLNK